jgi:hypothetical protein
MNTNSQPPKLAEVNSSPSPRQPAEASQNLMKNWLNVVSGRTIGGAGSASGVDVASLALNDGGLAGLPDSIQSQLLQERFRQSFDPQDGGAGTEFLDGNEDGIDMFSPASTGNSLDGAQSPSTAEQGNTAAQANASRAEQGATEWLEAGEESLDEDTDYEDIDEILSDGGKSLGALNAHETKVEPPQPLLPRDSTDYRWIEKFTDRVLIEVEARAADRNLSIQLSQDVIPNATLILSRTGGRWQLNADTDDDVAARGIEDAEQALGARFAARGLGDIQVSVGRGQQRSNTDLFA